MPSRTKHAVRPRIRPELNAVVQPVTRRLSRMEDLLSEMRHEQDVQLKRTTVLQNQLDALTEQLKVTDERIRRMGRGAAVNGRRKRRA